MNVMKRRLYLLLPQKQQALGVVEQLFALGIKEQHIHSIARKGIDVSALPKANTYQRNDAGLMIEQWLWMANLMFFFFAMLVFFVSLFNVEIVLAVLAFMMMLLTFSIGHYFATRVPHMHLAEFRAELNHGEILLLVDIPSWRVTTIERTLRKCDPALALGGIGWSIEQFSI